MASGRMNIDDELKKMFLTGKTPTGDKADQVTLRKFLAAFDGHAKKMEAIQSTAAAVQENIRKRAELREKKGLYGVPNIAKLLSGGAGSPISHMGRLQTLAGRPFKAQTENYKFQQAHQAKMQPGQGGWMDTGFADEKEYDTSQSNRNEAKKRAGGTAFLGKRMNQMIGKVGKFMESGKGQGLMAGGMLGASIFTMVIKKAMEASPMLQAMLKVMNTAMILFLRPIGDFIGGMLKPIMLFFLKEVAVPMLKAGKGMIKFGEQVGRQVLGFFLRPVETIIKAIVQALEQFPFLTQMGLSKQAEHWKTYDPIKDWASQQKMNALTAQLNAEGGLMGTDKELSSDQIAQYFEDMNMQNKVAAGELDEYTPQLDAETTALINSLKLTEDGLKFLGEFMHISGEKISHSYELISKKLDEASSGFAGASAIFSGWTLATGEAFGQLQRASEGLFVSFESVAVAVEFLKQALMHGMLPDWMDNLDEWLQEGKISMEEYEAAINYMIGKGLFDPLNKMKDIFGKMAEMTGSKDGMLGSMTASNTNFDSIKTTTDQMRITMVKAGQALKAGLNALKKAKKTTGRPNPQHGNQHGGMINEPIWGIGASGESYMFGEAGPERIIPTGASSRMDGGGIGPVIINVNVDSINSDVDLEKIKPVIERALLEVHAKRGMI